MAMTERDKYAKRWSQLKTERSSWMPHWQDISSVLLPRSGRFFVQDRNRGEKRYNNIYDSTGTRALRVLAAGMMSGMTSPARPWFRLTTADPDLANSPNVKQWLADVTRMMLDVFARSNTYRAFHSIYEELGAFGTASSIIQPSFNTVLWHYPLTVGEYALATGYDGRVNTLYREFEKSVQEVVTEFGYDKCSNSVKSLYDRGSLDSWVPIVHLVEPRAVRDTTKKDAKNMAFRSVHYEPGSNDQTFLRESGYKEFPALCPRWSVSGGDIYGNSPGMEALGDMRQLQHEQLRKAQAIDQQTKPTLQVPTSLKNQQIESLPGGVIYVDSANQNAAIRNAYDVNVRLDYLLADIQDVRQRVNQTFYADLFLMLANNTDSRMTATEVAERHEEKLLMLGPVLERLHNELLDPLIEMTFTRLVEARVIPPPPPELQNVDLNVEFVSMLAQAQRAVGTNSIDRFVGNLGVVAQMRPEVLDKFDPDQWAEVYSDMLGVDPRVLVSGDKVALIRQQRAQQQAAQQQAEMLSQSAQTARNLAAADTSGQNALTDVTKQFSGYSGV